MRTLKAVLWVALAAGCSPTPPGGNGDGGGPQNQVLDPNLCTIAVTPAQVVADGAAFARATVTVRDTAGAPISNQLIGLQVSGTGNTLPSAASTDGQGKVVLSFTSTVAEAKTVNAVLDPGGASQTLPPQAQVTFVAGPPASRSTLEWLTTAAPADGTTPARARLTLRDASGNLIVGAAVSFTASATEATAAPASGSTDAQGRLETLVTSTRSGLVTLTATSGGYVVTADFTFGAGTPAASTSTLTTAPTFAVADGVTNISLVTAVKDLGGTPVPGVSVSVSATGSGNVLLNTTGTTGSNGEHTATLNSTVAEGKQVTVSVAGGAFTLNRQVSFVAGAPSGARSTLTVSPATIPVFDSTLVTLTTRDGQGNIIGSVAVGFSANRDGGFVPDAGVTDGGGVLTSTFTALGFGAVTVTASNAQGFSVSTPLTVDGSCLDNTQDNNETDVDCGGGTCGKCADLKHCGVAADCLSDVCTGTVCQVPVCNDTKKNGVETGIDCGGDGGCNRCADDGGCFVDGDCQSQRCLSGACQAPTCNDARTNGLETDLDCGGDGGCTRCADSKVCNFDSDCLNVHCVGNACQPATCLDARKNGLETDLDCGGANACPRCGDGLRCGLDGDCTSQHCVGGFCAAPTCTDVRKNGVETDVDCGGDGGCNRCPVDGGCLAAADCTSKVCGLGRCSAPTCLDSVQNSVETDVDCGGDAGCQPCSDTKKCIGDGDCLNVHCVGGFCAAPTCTDVRKNGVETDVDCGGSSGCSRCADLKRCLLASDCTSGVCTFGICQVPTCTDSVKNGVETDRDCGGDGGCVRCSDDAGCGLDSDCLSTICLGSTCRAPSCSDNRKNGIETDVDCGGDGGCPRCLVLKGCAFDSDCANPLCIGAKCRELKFDGGTYGSGTRYFGLAVLNRPGGRPDLAVSDYSVSNLAVFSNDGGGGFTETNDAFAGLGPGGVTSGDLNGDGCADVVEASNANRDVEVLMCLADGGLSTPTPFGSFGTARDDVAVGDFNKDGKLDVVTSALRYAYYLPGDGDGGFSVGPGMLLCSSQLAKIAVGDVDGDGNLDFVAACNPNDVVPGSAVVVRGHGDGTFFPPVTYLAGLYSTGIALGDLDGDGRPELFVVNQQSASVSMFHNHGDGTFEAPLDVPVGVYPASAATGDFNADGFVDLAVANGDGTAHIFLGRGNGSLSPPLVVPIGTSATDLVAADLNGDGKVDLATSNDFGGGITVLISQCR